MLTSFIRVSTTVTAIWLCLLPAVHGFEHDHGGFTALLSNYVAEGRVDYSALVEQRARLDDYLESLQQVTEDEVASWTQSQQLAFWINAYNALALDTVVAHYPLKRRGLRGFAYPSSSIRQIADVWKLRRRAIGGALRSLDDIEHGIIRATFKEPRIHFALVCAAVSCPKLRSEAYQAEQLETQLAAQVADFLADTRRGLAIDPRRKRISVSSIFKWFPEDFPKPPASANALVGTTQQAGVVHFLSHAAPPAAKTALRSGDYRLNYLKYDWTLNDQFN